MTFLTLLMEKDLVLQMITITDDKESYNSQGKLWTRVTDLSTFMAFYSQNHGSSIAFYIFKNVIV